MSGLPSAAPRLDARLTAALLRLDKPGRPIAEVNRRLGVLAEYLGVPRPSYEQVRVALHEARRGRRNPSAGELLLDFAIRSPTPEAVFDIFGD